MVGTALQFLGGFPQFLVYTFYLLVPYAALRLACGWIGRTCSRPQVLRRGVALGLGCVLAPGLVGVQLLPTLELVGRSARRAKLSPDAVHYLDEALELPDLPGTLRNAIDPKPRLVSFDFSPDAGFLGTATLVMVCVALVLSRRNPIV